MRVLALDSTTRAGSVAVVDDDRIVVERSGDAARTHAERLPGEILSLGIPLSSIDLFAVASGPGSFTGLRIGIATVQGLAFARHARVVPISALEALAQIGGCHLPPGTIVGAWMDAHRHEVYNALYRVADGVDSRNHILVEIDAPAVGDPTETLVRWTSSGQAPAWIIGDGAVLYADRIDGRARVASPPPLAGAIGTMAIDRARRGGSIDPAGIQPLYIRRPDAELARDSRLFNTKDTKDDCPLC